MAIFKCKMCGGDLNVEEGITVCECEYCATKQTVPTADNEKKINAFNRANHLRSVCEFDKAAGVYESIVTEFPEESEAYWGLCLCKFGIEYVDDPATGKKIPTCHRTAYESIFEDSNFEQALEWADSVAHSVYRAEAKEIDRLQREILEIAKNEQPFDVFICYKESDENGQRTVDSELAHDIYDVLTEKGYKVFYSRITLKAKLGQDYEPYIFSALNSAKVMLAIGTKYEYYNAVWVKNEWSRFLALMSKENGKMLIPCYRDIDAYDMPREFKHLQGQDLSSPRAFQDLVSNIEKIIPRESHTEQVSAAPSTSDSATEPLIKRVFIFLEDENWDMANRYCEKVLDIDPENAEAYLGKLLAEFNLKNAEVLNDGSLDLTESNNFKKVIRFGNTELKNRIDRYCNLLTYNNAIALMQTAQTRGEFAQLAETFLSLGDLLDASQKAAECREHMDKCPGYDEALELMRSYDISDIYEAYKIFLSLGNHLDSSQKAEECMKIFEEEAKLKYRKAVTALSCSNDLNTLRKAQKTLLDLKDYRDSAQKAEECRRKLNQINN